MKTLVLTLTLFFPTMLFAKTAILTTASSTYVNVESYNDVDLTNMAIDFITDDALAAELAASQVCGIDKFHEALSYSSVDYVEDIGYLYSQPAASLITRLQEKTMLTAEDFNSLSFELNKTTNALMSYLEGKQLNVCADFSKPVYSGDQTTYFIMVDGQIEFAIFVGRAG